jgi:hypothetical protein
VGKSDPLHHDVVDRRPVRPRRSFGTFEVKTKCAKAMGRGEQYLGAMKRRGVEEVNSCTKRSAIESDTSTKKLSPTVCSLGRRFRFIPKQTTF